MESGDLIDRSLKKIISLTVKEFEAFNAETVADTLAHSLIVAANQGDMKALTIVADRAGGRATQKKEIAQSSAASERVKKFLAATGDDEE